MALYEVMSKARAKANAAKTVEPLQPVQPKRKPEKIQVPVVDEPIAAPEPQEATNWRKKPRIVQYNLGRIEFSIPYQLAITAGLAILLLFLLAFRFGQYSGSREPSVRTPQSNAVNPNREGELPRLSSTENTRTPSAMNNAGGLPIGRENTPAAAASTGGNAIVLVQYKAPTQLLPVQEYFEKRGITTEIVSVGNTYFLQTIERFKDNPDNPGTEGNKLIKKIAEIGKGYEAPPGYEPFKPHLFNDAYGRRIDN